MILSKSLRSKSFIVGPLLMALLAQGANAQTDEAASEGEEKAEVFRVTGSRIKQIDMESASSVTFFTREDLDKSGYGTVADFLRNSIPSGSMLTENETLNQVSGSSSFGGRDFTANYTLVLLNGRRLPINAIASDFVDLNLIPMAAVERIEYLTDGASAIYGSDAISGVLNIITRKKFDGVNVSTRIGEAERGDATETSFQVVGGSSTSRSNFLIAADSFKREPAFPQDRPLANSAIAPDGTDGRSPYGLPGFVVLADGSIQAFPDCPAEQQNSAGQCMFDVAPLYQTSPKSERQSIYTIFDYRLTDSVEFFGEARYSRAYTHIANGAAPGGVALKADAATNPYGQDITLYRRYVDFGPRRQDATNEAFSTVAGLRGELGANHSWSLEATSHRLRNLQVGAGGQINSPAAIEAFSDGTLDPFAFNAFDTPEKIAAFNAINTTTFREGISLLQTYSLAVDGQTPIELPGGFVGYATGIEFRKESFTDRSDNLSAEGRILGSAGSNGGGNRENEAVYFEIAAPVLNNLSLTTAGRYDNIDNKHDAFTYKFATSYSPIEALKLRASYGTGFKSADLHQLFLGSSFGVTRAIDPQTCGDNTTQCEIRTISGGNRDLEPETSVFYNFGIIGQVTDDLNLSLDYWDIEIDNKVSSLPLQAILNDPAKFGDLINRDPQGRLSTEGSFVRTNLQNLNKETSAGIEAKLSYAASTGIGQLSSSLILNKLVKSKAQNTAADPLCDFASQYKGVDGRLTTRWSQGGIDTSATIRHQSGFDSYSGGFTAGTCDRVNPDSRFEVEATTELDLGLTYQAPFATIFGVGINNVTDTEPAFDKNANWPWYNQQSYSNIGRFYYLSATHEFR
ncbi:MAG: TonB-dependent receptor [Oligoflexus sp.]